MQYGTWKHEMDRRDRFNRTITRDGKPFMYISFYGYSGYTPRGEVDDAIDRYADLIAEAPAMLAELREMMALIESTFPSQSKVWLDNANAIIKRIEG